MRDPVLQELAKVKAELAQVQKQLRTLSNTPTLTHASLDNATIRVKDREGDVTQVIGRQSDGSFGDRVVKSGPQPKPSRPIVSAGTGSISNRWDGQAEFGGTDAVPQAFGRIEVWGAPGENADFTAASHLSSIYSREGGTTFIRATPGVWQIWFVMVGADGRTRSIPSEPAEVSVEKIVEEGDIEAWIRATVDGDLEDAAYDTLAARLGMFIRVTAGNIEANAIQAMHLAVGALDGDVITGALVQSNNHPTRGTKLTDEGIVAYDSSGRVTVWIDGEQFRITSPDSLFEGNIRAHSMEILGDIRVGPESEGRLSPAPGGRIRIEGRMPQGIAPRDLLTAGATPFIAASGTYNRVTVNYGVPAWEGSRIPFMVPNISLAASGFPSTEFATQDRTSSSFTALVRLSGQSSLPAFSVSYHAIWADF